mgnify:CR=1 FL=1
MPLRAAVLRRTARAPRRWPAYAAAAVLVAALAGAQSLAVHPLYAGEAVGSLPIDAARAQQSVVSYLAATDMDLSLVGVVVDGDRVTVEVAAQAGAKTLALFHHDPSHHDAHIDELLDRVRSRDD